MKPATALAFAMLVLAAGCGDKSSQPSTSPTNSVATNSSTVLTAPVDYLGALAKAQQSAVKTVDTTSLNQAIQLFQVDKGRYPRDLNELVQERFIGQIPKAPYGMKIVYDANTGTVKVVKE